MISLNIDMLKCATSAPHQAVGDRYGANFTDHHGEDVVVDVARVVAQRFRRRVREDDRGARDAQRVPHRRRRHMRQVNQHAQTVHLHNYQLFPEIISVLNKLDWILLAITWSNCVSLDFIEFSGGSCGFTALIRI